MLYGRIRKWWARYWVSFRKCVFGFLRLVFRLKPCMLPSSCVQVAMVSVKRCQHCYAHRSANRRRCAGCGLMVAPGCWPEQCLVRDSQSGDGFNVCRTCWGNRHRQILKCTAQNLGLVLEKVLESEFWAGSNGRELAFALWCIWCRHRSRCVTTLTYLLENLLLCDLCNNGKHILWYYCVGINWQGSDIGPERFRETPWWHLLDIALHMEHYVVLSVVFQWDKHTTKTL